MSGDSYLEFSRRTAIGSGLAALTACAAAPGNPITIAFEENEGRVYLPVKVAAREGRAMLDNGSTTILDQTLDPILKRGDLLGLAGAKPLRTPIVQNGEKTIRLEDVEIVLGQARLRTNPSLVSMKSWAPELIAVAGYEVFQRWIVGVDYDAGKVTLHERAGFSPSAGFATIALRNAAPEKWAIPLDLGGVAVEALIDLGSSTALCLSAKLAARCGVSAFGDRPWNLLQGGLMKVGVATTARVSLAGTSLQHVLTEILPANAIDAWKWDAVLGAPALSRFRSYFDLPAGKLWLAPGNRASRPFLPSCQGFVGGLKNGVFKVASVAPLGPAAKAGLKAGDVVLSVNGLSMQDKRAYLGEPGSRIELTLADGRTLSYLTATYRDAYY